MIFDDRGAEIETRQENSYLTEHNPAKSFYPVNILRITLVRDPIPCVISIYLPTALLAVFLFRCCWIEDLKPRMENVSIVILGQIAIFGQLRETLPPLESFTWAEMYVLVNLAISLMPIHQNEAEDIHPNLIIILIMSSTAILNLIMLIKYLTVRHRKKITIMKMEKKKYKEDPDAGWVAPNDKA